MGDSTLANIHIDPEKVLTGVEEYKRNTLNDLQVQITSLQTARSYIASANSDWFGGHGGTGRLQERSRTFLSWLASEVDQLAAEQSALHESFATYLDGLATLANNVQAADNSGAELMKSIAKQLEA